jgi:hypothetical protein
MGKANSMDQQPIHALCFFVNFVLIKIPHIPLENIFLFYTFCLFIIYFHGFNEMSFGRDSHLRGKYCTTWATIQDQ